MKRAEPAFLDAFWEAPQPRSRGRAHPRTANAGAFSHLLHHGFSAVEQLEPPRRAASSLIDAGAPDEMLTRALQARHRRGQGAPRIRPDLPRHGGLHRAFRRPVRHRVGHLPCADGHRPVRPGHAGQGGRPGGRSPHHDRHRPGGGDSRGASPTTASPAPTATRWPSCNSFAYDVSHFLATGLKASPRADARDQRQGDRPPGSVRTPPDRRRPAGRQCARHAADRRQRSPRSTWCR